MVGFKLYEHCKRCRLRRAKVKLQISGQALDDVNAKYDVDQKIDILKVLIRPINRIVRVKPYLLSSGKAEARTFMCNRCYDRCDLTRFDKWVFKTMLSDGGFFYFALF